MDQQARRRFAKRLAAASGPFPKFTVSAVPKTYSFVRWTFLSPAFFFAFLLGAISTSPRATTRAPSRGCIRPKPIGRSCPLKRANFRLASDEGCTDSVNGMRTRRAQTVPLLFTRLRTMVILTPFLIVSWPPFADRYWDCCKPRCLGVAYSQSDRKSINTYHHFSCEE